MTPKPRKQYNHGNHIETEPETWERYGVDNNEDWHCILKQTMETQAAKPSHEADR